MDGNVIIQKEFFFYFNNFFFSVDSKLAYILIASVISYFFVHIIHFCELVLVKYGLSFIQLIVVPFCTDEKNIDFLSFLIVGFSTDTSQYNGS